MSFDFNGIFSYEDAKNHYKSMDQICKTNDECIDGSICGNISSSNETLGKCTFFGYCLEDDMKICSIQKDLRSQCKNNDRECCSNYIDKNIECVNNEDCLSNKCFNSTCVGSRTYVINLGENEEKYGLDDGEKCTKDSECMFGACREGNICGPPYTLGFSGKTLTTVFIGFLLLILLCVFACCFGCRKIKQKKELVKKNKNTV